MTITCPGCRHVVDLEEGGSRRCPNCGEVVRAPVFATATPPGPADDVPQRAADTAPPVTSPPVAPTVAVPGMPTPSVTRAAPIVAFIAGLLFFLPFVTQVIGICAALFALVRPRLAHERVALAWVGLVLCAIALPAWILFAVFAVNLAATSTSFSVTTGTVTATSQWPPADGPGWEHTTALIDEMKSIHRAATAYHRDYRKWPADVESLVGGPLPRGFRMSPDLEYRPVPASETFSTKWVLIVSGPVHYEPDGEFLDEPHRLVLRLNGKVELLPDAETEELLAAQPIE